MKNSKMNLGNKQKRKNELLLGKIIKKMLKENFKLKIIMIKKFKMTILIKYKVIIMKFKIKMK